VNFLVGFELGDVGIECLGALVVGRKPFVDLFEPGGDRSKLVFGFAGGAV
jgi:hypothetical protein